MEPQDMNPVEETTEEEVAATDADMESAGADESAE